MRFVAIVTLTGALALGVSASADEKIRAKIPPDVYVPYKPSGHPKTFAYFGASQVRGPIQRLREDAALAVAGRADCDRIETSDFSTLQSSLTRHIVFVDCSNGARFYVDQNRAVSRR